MKRFAAFPLLAAFLVSMLSAAEPPPPPTVVWRVAIAPDGQSMILMPEGGGKFNIVNVNGLGFLWVDPATGKPWFYNLGISATLTPLGPLPPPPPPPSVLIESFTATPEMVAKGQPSTLAWKATKAKTVTLNSVTVAVAGTQVVAPEAMATYTLVASGGATTETAQRIVTVTDIPPPPPPPIPDLGLRVLIVEETSQRGSLPKPQQEILLSTAAGSVREYLTANCVKGPDGKTAEWRIVDKDAVFTQEAKLWQDARKKFDELKTTVPGWIVSNGKEGIAGALPATPAEALTVLKQFTPPGGKP